MSEHRSFPEPQVYERGLLDVGDGNLLVVERGCDEVKAAEEFTGET